MKILVSALEPSANLHLRELVKYFDDVRLEGIFDERLGSPMYSPDSFSVMGFIDTFFKIRLAKQAIKALVKKAKEVDKVLLIDGPAFNLPLAKAIKKAYPDKEIIYYILPKVWAWKAGRAKKVMRYTDKQLSIFPFEQSYYPASTFVGNPLVDEITQVNDSLNSANNVAFLAGSRKREIRYLMPVLREVRKRLALEKAYLVIPEHFSDDYIAALYGDISMFEVVRDTRKAVLESEYAFVCSGTATLETAYIGTPFVLIYITNKWEFKLMRYLVHLPYVGLANLLFYFDNKEPMHTELLQEDVSADNLVHAYQNEDREAFFEKVGSLRAYLGDECAVKVANIIQN